MRRIVIGFFFSLLIVFIIWFITGYIVHGDSLYDKHLDLYGTFKLLDLESLNVNFGELIQYLSGDLTLIKMDLPDWLAWFDNFLTILIVPFIFIFKLLLFLVNLLKIIFTLVLNPKFI